MKGYTPENVLISVITALKDLVTAVISRGMKRVVNREKEKKWLNQ